ncbi:hypothetical protein L1049_010346 [Liquidambar formosana]|uniref:Uncharacterized protein n=1 Tax=Liquidambar formosana TaxID=63359 RepID=A0AAP0NAX3_LIQFO
MPGQLNLQSAPALQEDQELHSYCISFRLPPVAEFVSPCLGMGLDSRFGCLGASLPRQSSTPARLRFPPSLGIRKPEEGWVSFVIPGHDFFMKKMASVPL